MMLRMINRPVKLSREIYNEAIEFLAVKYSKLPGLKSFYKFGNVTAPGISDLDLLFVFEDGIICNLNGFEELPDRYKPLFTHGIMAVCESDFHRNNYYTIWSDHELVAGKKLNNTFYTNRTPAQEKALRIQTAVEFILANYIDLKVQITYGVVKLRSFLQHMKGILYDLDLLDLQNTTLHPLLHDLKQKMMQWNEVTVTDAEISQWIMSFDKVFSIFSNDIFQKHPLYLPALDSYTVAKNMKLMHSDSLSMRHTGVLLPSFTQSLLGKNYFRIQNRLNHFTFSTPISNQPADPFLAERFEFLRKMKAYNRTHLPAFMTMTTSITSKML